MAVASRRALGGASLAGAAERFVHDGAHRAGAAAALRAAAEATIDLDSFPRAGIGGDSVAHLGLGKHVAGTDNHGHFPRGRLE